MFFTLAFQVTFTVATGVVQKELQNARSELLSVKARVKAAEGEMKVILLHT